MLTMINREIFTESPEEDLWRELLQYSYRANVSRYLKEHSLDEDEDTINTIIGSFLQANEYFKASKSANLQISPLLLYYGATNLLLGLTSLMTGKRPEIKNHGMTAIDSTISTYIAEANVVFGVYEKDTDQPVEEMSLARDYYGWIFVGNKELEKGKDYYVLLHNHSFDYWYSIEYSKEVYSGYSTAISIDPYATINTGGTKELAVQFYPDDTYSALTWASSDNTVATVDSMGTVYAKKAGTCDITATTQDGYTATCIVTVKNPAPYLNYKSKSVYRGSSFRLILKYPLGKATYKSTNKKIATVSSSGVVKGKKLGTCTIKVTSKGKTYYCKVKVVRAKPNFGAVLYDYNTRSNKFVVKVKNWGTKTLYIKKGTGKVEDVDYKSFDRKVKLYKTVKIKPKSSKTLYFKVQGRTTWYDYSDFTLFYKFTYDGKNYTWHVWDEDSVMKTSNGWYSTYWDEDKYFDYLINII